MRIEFEYGGYNPRRYGMPWGAIGKLEGWRVVWDLSAGTFEGDSVKGGKLHIECQPGDIIATGQNFWDREDYIHDGTLYVVREDGSLKQLAKVTILEYGEGRQEPEPPLAKYSTEELIAELHRRGVNVDHA